MNQLFISGNIATDIKEGTTQAEKLSASFGVMISSPFNYNESCYVNVKAYGNNASYLIKNYSKGSRIVIQGSLYSHLYEKTEGKKELNTYVVVDSIVATYSSNKINEVANDTKEDSIEVEHDIEIPF